MVNSKKVGIVIPVYNVENYIKQCLTSVKNQTFQNWIAILVDDGSTDNSGKICDKYCDEDFRFKVIHKKNQGLNFARRDGASFLRAENVDYITFVDSDDAVNSEYLSVLVKTLEEQNADIARCGWQKFIENANLTVGDISCQCTKDEVIVYKTQNDIICASFGVGNFEWLNYATWAGLYKMSYFDSINWGLSNTKSNEDMPLLMQVYPWVEKVALTNKKLYYYRQRVNQKTLSRNFEFVDYRGRMINQFENLADEYKIFQNYYVEKGLKYQNELFARNILRSLQVLATAIDMNYDKQKCQQFIKNLLDETKTKGGEKSKQFWTKKMKFLIMMLNFGGYSFYKFMRICFNIKNKMIWK